MSRPSRPPGSIRRGALTTVVSAVATVAALVLPVPVPASATAVGWHRLHVPLTTVQLGAATKVHVSGGHAAAGTARSAGPGTPSAEPRFHAPTHTRAVAAPHPNVVVAGARRTGGTAAAATASTDPPVLVSRFGGMTLPMQVAAFGAAAESVEPPDDTIAVSPTQILEATNQTLSLWSRSGKLLWSRDLLTLWPVFAPWHAADPRVAYDPATGQFFVSDVVFNGNKSMVLLGHSTSPSTVWALQEVGVHITDNVFADEPRLGFSSGLVVVSWDDFNAQDAWLGSETVVLDKAQYLANGSVTVTRIGPDLTRFGLTPAVSVTPTSTQYIVYNNSCGTQTSGSCTVPGTSTLGLLAVTGTPTASSVQVSEADPTIVATTIPPNAPQRGTTRLVDTGDDRLIAATFSSGVVSTSADDACTPPGDTVKRPCSRLITVTTGATPSIGLDVDLGHTGWGIYYPTAAPDSAGNLILSTTVSASSAYPEAVAWAVRTDGTVAGDAVLASGGTYYTGTRWGDYGGAAVDPANPDGVVLSAEYAPSNANAPSWATEIGEMTLLGPVVTAVSPAFGTAGASVTVSGTGFQPGATVSFGSTAAPGAVVVSSQKITVPAPVHALGAVDVTVGPSNGSAFVSAADQFRYVNGTHSDLLAVDHAGALWRYPGNGGGELAARVRVGSSGWSAYTALLGTGDMNGDGHVDLVARDSSGRLWLYKGTGAGGLQPRVLVGTSGWNTYTALIAPGDMNGDGHPDIVGRDSAGQLWLYTGTGSGGVAIPRVLIGTSGWNSYTALLGPGDLDGDGHADVMGRDSAGKLWLYHGSGTGGVVIPRVLVGTSGWNTYNVLLTPRDFNGDGTVDLLGRDAAGALWLYAGSGTGGLGTRTEVGVGWSGYSAIVGVGNLAQ